MTHGRTPTQTHKRHRKISTGVIAYYNLSPTFPRRSEFSLASSISVKRDLVSVSKET